MSAQVLVPDVGEAQDIEVVELLVSAGDAVTLEQSLVVLESDKASMEIPAPYAGTILRVAVAEGDKVEEGSLLVEMEVAAPDTAAAQEEAPEKAEEKPEEKAEEKPEEKALQEEAPAAARSPVSSPAASLPAASPAAQPSPSQSGIHAGPAVRKQAREYGVELARVPSTGRKGRILKEDIQRYVKAQLNVTSPPAGAGIPPVPELDFTKWGEVQPRPLSRIQKLSAKSLHRSWLNVPHVTQFDEADITDLEASRKAHNASLSEGAGTKLTPLAFLIEALVKTLIEYPQFNASLAADYEHLLLKKYYHIGIAVETEAGLVVPVIKEANKKTVVELAEESAALAEKARSKRLSMSEMQGASFTISSLGGLGGTAFTPIVNAPEVAILGVSRAKVSPVYDGSAFVPRTLLPLSLSYDHRAIDGAEAVRFVRHLALALEAIKQS